MDSNSVFSIFLVIHILCGGIALFVAPAAMVAHKGGLWHRRWGKIFFWSMAVVAATAIVMSLIRSGLFLLLVALFSFYLAFTGYRVLYRKTPRQPAEKADWLAVIVVAAGSVALVAYGIYLTLTSSFGAVPVVFGAIGIFLAAADTRTFLNQPTDKQAWWYAHMTRMIAAYIATVTAFSAVNFHFLPPVTRWLWATVVGVIGSSIWTRYYKKKFNRISPQK